MPINHNLETNPEMVTTPRRPSEDSGDASMLLLIVFILILGLQCGIQLWKNHHPKSYNATTLFFMWLLPGGFSIYNMYLRMVMFWTIFTLYSGYIFFLVYGKKVMDTLTPRRVYKYLYFLYRLSHGTMVFGSFLCLLQFFGIHDVFFTPEWWNMHPVFSFFVPSAEIIVFYSLYYSVMVRDVADLLSTSIRKKLNARSVQLYRTDCCDICKVNLKDDVEQDPESLHLSTHDRFKKDKIFVPDETIHLNCNHKFHEFCIRGWIILGKKDCCPTCNEKVDSNELGETQPWNADSPLYTGLLEMLRYILVWNPLVILIIQGFLHFVSAPIK